MWRLDLPPSAQMSGLSGDGKEHKTFTASDQICFIFIQNGDPWPNRGRVSSSPVSSDQECAKLTFQVIHRSTIHNTSSLNQLLRRNCWNPTLASLWYYVNSERGCIQRLKGVTSATLDCDRSVCVRYRKPSPYLARHTAPPSHEGSERLTRKASEEGTVAQPSGKPTTKPLNTE